MSCGAKVNQETYWRSKEGRDGGVRGVGRKGGEEGCIEEHCESTVNKSPWEKGMNWIINDDVRVSRDDSNYRASHTDNFQPRRSQKEVTFNNWQQLCLCFLLSALIG